MPVRRDMDGDPRGLRRGNPPCARTGSRPRSLGLRRVFPGVVAASLRLIPPAGRDPAPSGGAFPTVARCNPHSTAAREAASFNATLDRARATPAVPLSTPRLHVVFCALQTRRSAKRYASEFTGHNE